MIWEVVISGFVLVGGFFCFAAGLGVLRFPDLLIRMHASTKAGTLGSGLILTAVALTFAEGTVIARAVAAILFLLLTAPVAAHLMGRAAFRTGVPMVPNTEDKDGVEPKLMEAQPDQAPR
ncbi:monovalent cation/H(+) antiporter subunit G [Paracoccus sp. (in: a-proteobacteria)]|uniref:monovalent cation/H(+) antiporter subunit G n=1 Tax=Paracoccus sp. TaxID=267 RepID=UPI0026DF69FE|nr:monovalent cation/H(+) antiporter subunit G [Paracoccus sp. (in: a-proteobacteria)]MDO5646633.1 monovalent cation/H(+) antiporter subunit G [Paracoccus sp. (in: a-proteobacteria)]